MKNQVAESKEPSIIDENAWVVEDLQAAMETWLNLGFGPFFVISMDLPEVRHRTARVPLSLKIAIARAGNVHVELIQQMNDGPSAFRDVYPAGQGGFHHIRRQASTGANGLSHYDAMAETFARNGVDVVMEMQFGAQRIGYADTRATLGCMMEFYDPSDAVDSLKRLTAAAAVDWDGSDPIRMLDLADL